jgi:hypothetical protein
MLINKFYNGIELYRENKIIYAKLTVPLLVISTCGAEGGIREDCSFI